MELCHIFSRVAAWRAEDDSHAIVQSTFLISKAAEMQHALDRMADPFFSRKALGDRGSLRSGKANNAMAPSPGGVEIAAMVSSASTLGACRLGRAVFQQPLGIQASQLDAKASVLIHRPDRNTKPFRQFVTSHCPDDEAPPKKGLKDFVAIAHAHENKICRAWDKFETHR
jgi:hypothetical protein